MKTVNALGTTRSLGKLLIASSLVLSSLVLSSMPGQLAWSGPADELKVSQLEDEVRDLQRQVVLQNRRIEKLENQLSQLNQAQPRTRDSVKQGNVGASTASSPRWLNNVNWDRIHVGMTEAETLTLLGSPTTVRNDGNGRTLFYAVELDAGGFLSGRVLFAADRVIEVHKPALR